MKLFNTAALVLLLAPIALGAGRTTVTSFKATAGVDAARVVWEAQVPAGVAGWAIEWRCYSELGGATTRSVKPNVRDYTIRGLKPGRVYAVRIYPYVTKDKTIARAPVSGQTRPLMVRVGRPADAAPAAPRGLRAAADDTRVRLTWAPSPELHVAGYEILRKGPGDEKPALHARINVAAYRPTLERPGGGNVRLAGPAVLIESGLETDKEYAYSVRVFTADTPPKYSAEAGPVTVRTKPYRVQSGDILFVVNTESKNAVKIARTYARVRGVRNPRAVKIKVPAQAEISRDDYDRKLLAPVRAFLRKSPRTTIVILVRGVPWRIREDDKTAGPARYDHWTRASVESDLALARFEDYPVQGRLRNPLYNKAAPLTPVDGILGVCRLDAPEDRVANELVKKAVDAEKRGVNGIAFFDSGGPYHSGNRAIKSAAEMVRKDGRLQVKIDHDGPVIDLSTLKDTIGYYYGWYGGHFQPKNKRFRFGRGAVAVHLHSFAAYRVWSKTRHWVGPFLMHGATATLGTADEPLLDGFPTADALTDALLKGCNFAEASLSASRYLSWMSVNIGDPLYRPFKPQPNADLEKALEEAL